MEKLTINSIAELLEFAILKLEEYTENSIIFKGEEIEVTRITLDYVDVGILKKGIIFLISCSTENCFDFQCIKGVVHFDKQYKCIVIPDKYKEILTDYIIKYEA